MTGSHSLRHAFPIPHFLAQNGNLPLRHRKQTADAFKEHRLAGPIPPDDAVDFSPLQTDGNPVYRYRFLEFLGHMNDFNGVFHVLTLPVYPDCTGEWCQ